MKHLNKKQPNKFITWVRNLSSYTKNKTINALLFWLAFFIIGGTNYFIMVQKFVPTLFVLDFFIIVFLFSPIFFFKTTKFDRIYLPIVLFFVTFFYIVNSCYCKCFGTAISIKDLSWALGNLKTAAKYTDSVDWWIVWLNAGLYVFFALGIILFGALWKFNPTPKELKLKRRRKIAFALAMLAGSGFLFETSLQIWNAVERHKGHQDIDYVNYSPTYHFKNLGMLGYYTQELRQIIFDKGESVEAIKKYMNAASYITNEYTGLLQGSNIIVIVIETGDQMMLNEYTTPNLWNLLNNGINCNKNYSYNHSNQSDMLSICGNYTNTHMEYNPIFKQYGSKLSPFALPNILKNKYRTTYTSDIAKSNDIYGTMDFIKNFNFDNYWFHNDMIPEVEPWLYGPDNFTRDSLFMNAIADKIKTMPEDKPFYMHYFTIHMHMNHALTDGNKKMYQELENEFGSKLDSAAPSQWTNPFDPSSEDGQRFRRYTLNTMDFDKGLGNIMNVLYGSSSSNYLKNTLIVPFGDHYWYERCQNGHIFAQEVRKAYDFANVKQYATVMGMYHPKLNQLFSSTHPDHKLNLVTNPAVITPTILNLLGEKYNPRMYMGKSIFDSSYDENEVMYSFWNNSYMNENFTSMDGYSITNTFDGLGSKEKFLKNVSELRYRRRIIDSIYNNAIFANYNYEDFMPLN